MDRDELKKLLDHVADGSISPETALNDISLTPIQNIGYAQLDLARGIRQGTGEVIYGAGKTADQITGIVTALHASGQKRILITRLDKQKALAVTSSLSQHSLKLNWDETSHLGIIGENAKPDGTGTMLVACAGTSDLPVAEEAAQTAEFLGNSVERLIDVGVAGIHRLLSHASQIADAQVIIAVAGMEGALASVIGGLSSAPVIAVPTSVGYGAGAQGIAALLAMLNSCSSGVSVVNIDNGFGAGFQAHLINHVGCNH